MAAKGPEWLPLSHRGTIEWSRMLEEHWAAPMREHRAWDLLGRNMGLGIRARMEWRSMQPIGVYSAVQVPDTPIGRLVIEKYSLKPRTAGA